MGGMTSHEHQLDAILINGVPVAQIELKTLDGGTL
jgi:type I site-specific restriction-modification system R (restriction) subunit